VKSTLCQRAAQLLRVAAPDDFMGPVYVLRKHTLPEPFRSLPAGGWAGPCEDIRFRQVIEKRLGWQERGPCLIVTGQKWAKLLPIVLHEAAHVIAEGWPFDDPNEQPGDERMTVAVANFVLSDLKSVLSRKSHDLKYCRSLAHLCGRIPWSTDNGCFEERVFQSERYGLPEWRTIRRTFSAEVWERRYEPVRSILESPCPEEAARLFCD
jgi:hypothetical protein